jgi:DNA-binding transcriptional MerR regulator
MENKSSQLINDILEQIIQGDYVDVEDLPNINLYMDQVTTLMEKELGFTKRNEEDKILTKTMINNYAKNNLLPPPEKKKYSKEQLLMLIFIYYLKNIISIKDIDKIISPITSNCNDSSSSLDFSYIYNEIIGIQKDAGDSWHQSILDTWEISSNSFKEASKHQEYLQLFSFICSLSFDVFNKKLLIEKLIDQLPLDDLSKE